MNEAYQINAFKDVPDTSVKAYRKEKDSGRGKNQQQVVLDLLQRLPGYTTREYGELCEIMDAYQIARACSALQKIGAIVKGDKKRCTTNGNEMYTWKVIHTNIGGR